MKSVVRCGVLTASTALALALSFSASQANAHATFTLKPTPKRVAWGYYDAKAVAVLNSKPELGGLCPAKCDIL
jgi:hypothetical protein